MNKKDYLEELNRLDEIIIKTKLVNDLLVREFKLECTHEQPDLVMVSSYEEDEYGRHMESWTKHYYTCNNCCTTSGGFSKKLKSVQDIQGAITAIIKREYKQ